MVDVRRKSDRMSITIVCGSELLRVVCVYAKEGRLDEEKECFYEE